MLKKIFVSRLIELRKEAKLTQEGLGKAIGANRGIISNLESGLSLTNPDYTIRLADYFDVSLDYLYGRTDNRHGKYFNSNSDDRRPMPEAI